MKKIAVLTYQIKHRKTFDVLSLLKANGYQDVSVYATPLHYQKKKFPIYQHRPEMNYDIPDIEDLCKNLGYEYSMGQMEEFKIDNDRFVLVAGAGILPDSFVKNHIVINSHPGYIPNCRGLDAFKWAINDNQPIGVTTHLIGDYIDAGQVIERRIIPVYLSDTFHAVAERVYENEVSMLVEAIKKYSLKTLDLVLPGEFEVHRRMPSEVEDGLMHKFEEYRSKHGIERT